MKIPETIRRLIDNDALFVLNDSGGKDSQAMRILLSRVVPTSQLLVVHATLGEFEWPGALEHAQTGAERFSLPFVVARATKTFFEMVDRRYQKDPSRPCWPSSATRQCTSDLKRGPIEREVRRWGVQQVVSCMGIRALESPKRAKLDPLKFNTRNSRAGREWWDWLPIFDLPTAEVFETIAAAGEEPHYAYKLGNKRLSCLFCILASRGDLQNAARHHPEMYQYYVEREERYGYTMHQSRVPLKVLVEGKSSNALDDSDEGCSCVEQ